MFGCHQLAPKNMMDRIPICKALAKQKEINPFLKRMRGEAAQTVTKPGLTARNVLLCIWLDWKGITFYELLPCSQTLNSDLYCQQLEHLKLAIYQKRREWANKRGVASIRTTPDHTLSVVTRQNIWELGWEVLMHPPYSLDLAPSDYHLFLALQNLMISNKLGSREDCENRLLDVFTNKGQDIYERDIMKLPLKW
ncbi:mariner Mos1 transposase [Trichonephila clavipes]|nr:mariner Mos1 transposase [Trichonephila clavipes]